MVFFLFESSARLALDGIDEIASSTSDAANQNDLFVDGQLGKLVAPILDGLHLFSPG